MSSTESSDIIYLDGSILYMEPNQDYGDQEIEHLFTQISELTKELESWVFYQRIGPKIGVSTSGVKAICKHYLKLETSGCKALATECDRDNLYINIIYERLPKELTLPIKISSNPDTLMAFLDEHLSVDLD